MSHTEEELVENPIGLVEELIIAKIGDRGRLEYLKDSLKKGKRIYNSDRVFLKKMQSVLENRHPEWKHADKNPEIETPSVEVIKRPSYDSAHQVEKAASMQGSLLQIERQKSELAGLIKSLNSLKETQIDMVGRLGAIVDALESSYEKQRTVKEEADQHISRQPKDSPKDSKKQLHTDLLVWGAAGSFVLWAASLFDIVSIGSAAEILLGISVGLATGASISYKTQKT